MANNDVKEIVDKKTGKTKKVIKGERIKFYNDYVRIYRNSRGMLKPSKEVLAADRYGVGDFVNQYPTVTYESKHDIEIESKNESDKTAQLHIIKQQRKVKSKKR